MRDGRSLFVDAGSVNAPTQQAEWDARQPMRRLRTRSVNSHLTRDNVAPLGSKPDISAINGLETWYTKSDSMIQFFENGQGNWCAYQARQPVLPITA